MGLAEPWDGVVLGVTGVDEFVRRPELDMLLEFLERRAHRGVLVVGMPGVGKTTLLRQAEMELGRRGRPVFLISCRGVSKIKELSERILAAVRSSRFAGRQLLEGDVLRRTSEVPFADTVAVLVGTRLQEPVLMLDGLDEAVYPDRLVSGIQQLVLDLQGWSIVVSSREFDGLEFRHSRDLARLSLAALSYADVKALARLRAPSASDDEVELIARLSDGLPLVAALLASAVEAGMEVGPDGMPTLLAWWVDNAISTSTDPAAMARVVNELALFGGSCSIEALAARLDIPVRTLRGHLGSPLFAGADAEWTRVSFAHDMIQDFVLAERVRFEPISLADLEFGAEEAEKDRLLESTFVENRNVRTILDQRQSVVVGDRGSGKSALFRKLSASGSEPVRVCPVTDAGDMLHRVVAADGWHDAQALRAAWLVVVAAVVAGEIPESAPRSLRRTARDLCAALGRPETKTGRMRRFVRAMVRPLLGTKLSFAVGPVTLQAELPAGASGRHGKALLDVSAFLRDADAQLKANGKRVIVMFDRVDETFKYDRAKQEPIVQALLQAEGQVTLLDNTALIIFVRTDLFELYDIQEKNKLVSRTLTLDWDEEKWLQVLVGRVLANEGLRLLADRTPMNPDRIRATLPLVFPPEVEGQPIDRWLLDGLRNGNGDISPRLAVLLLHLARKRADEAESTVVRLPLFSATTLGAAMTQLSELSFTEVVTDFKVAPSFVANCRAGRLETFRLGEVEELFDLTEGAISEQVRLLERLGFLERVVLATHTGVESRFHVPRLYTRCWDYA